MIPDDADMLAAFQRRTARWPSRWTSTIQACRCRSSAFLNVVSGDGSSTMGSTPPPAYTFGGSSARFVSSFSSVSGAGGSRLRNVLPVHAAQRVDRPILGLAVTVEVAKGGDPLPVPRHAQERVDAFEPISVLDELPVVGAGLAPVRFLRCRNDVAVRGGARSECGSSESRDRAPFRLRQAFDPCTRTARRTTRASCAIRLP